MRYAGGAFTCKEILAKEQDMLQTLRWRIMPDTLNVWLDSFVSHWDLFVMRLRHMERGVD